MYLRATLISVLHVALICSPAVAKSDRVITVMSYNAENLFDTTDNPNNPKDNSYLPRSQKNTAAHKALCEAEFGTSAFYKKECLELDWSEATLTTKLKNLGAVVDGFDGGAGPDILMLQEVENQNILNRFTDALKKGASYVSRVNLEQSPGRGINVALISKFPMAGPAKSLKVEFAETDRDECHETRDILEVSLTLPDGNILTVFGLHFPSGSNPVKCRRIAAERLNEIVSTRPKKDMLVAMGDTNINCTTEDQAVISEVLQDQWIVPYEAGKGCRAPGSNFYPAKGQWSFLDLIVTSRSLASYSNEGAAWFADFGSFRTVISAPEVQVETDAKGRVKPKRFEPTDGTGTSDHWPVAIDLVRRK